MDFVKMEGLGNDFIVVDAPFIPDIEVIRRWCDRRFGVGADGVLEIGRVGPHRISMRYWNADGGEAEMCGNGLRCLAVLAVQRGWVESAQMVVESAMGDLPAKVQSNGLVRALVGRPHATGDPFQLADVTIHPVSVGNPHAVVFVEDPATTDVAGLGSRIETDPLFPYRTNVEFITSKVPGSIEARIWERGVGETMASGTGATAAAFAAIATGAVEAPVEVNLPGGRLTIEFEDGQAWMTGPGNVVFEGSLP